MCPFPPNRAWDCSLWGQLCRIMGHCRLKGQRFLGFSVYGHCYAHGTSLGGRRGAGNVVGVTRQHQGT